MKSRINMETRANRDRPATVTAAAGAASHLICGQAKVVGHDLPVAEPAREVVDDVLVVQLVVLVQVLLEGLLL